MRKLAFLLLFAVAGSTSAATPSASKTALVNELMELTHGGDTGMNAFVGLVAQESGVDVRIRTPDVLAERLTESQLKELVTFFKSDAGKAYCDALEVVRQQQTARLTATLESALDRSRKKRTMADLRTIAIASESYAADYGKYPEAKTTEELRPLLSPTYVRNMPAADAWGTPFAYVVSADHQTYRFVSAGPDKTFDPSSLKLGTKPAKSDDIVFENGEFLEAPLTQQ